jgi:hypothetical protein
MRGFASKPKRARWPLILATRKGRPAMREGTLYTYNGSAGLVTLY